MTRLLADENIPGSSVNLLRESGWDVEWVAEERPGMGDEEVLKRARQGHRLLLTFDRDFGELLYRRRYPVPPGVIYLRFVPGSPEEPAAAIGNLLSQEDIPLPGRFTVVSRDKIRQRPLP